MERFLQLFQKKEEEREFQNGYMDENGYNWTSSALDSAFLTKNRDALISILTYRYSRADMLSSAYLNIEEARMNNLSWKEGAQTLMLLIKCTPENCCRDYGRIEMIKVILERNKLDFPFDETFVQLAPCPLMKEVLRDWIQDTESFETRRAKKRKHESNWRF